MSEGRLPSSSEFRRRIVGLSCMVSAIGLAIVFVCLHGLLELTSEQWLWLIGLIAIYTAIISYPNVKMTHRMLAPVGEYLDCPSDGGETAEVRKSAFAALVDLPRRNALIGAASWVVPTLVVGIAMAFRFEQWGLSEFVVMVVSGIAAGFVAGSVLLYATKMAAQPIRDALVKQIPDPQTRRSLIRPLSLRTKLMVCIAGVALVPVIFAVLLARSQAAASFERFTVAWHDQLLDSVMRRAAGQGAGGAALGDVIASIGDAYPAPVTLSILDLKDEGGSARAERLDPVIAERVKQQLQQGVGRGTSENFASPIVFAWRRIGDDRILMAITPLASIRVDAAGGWVLYAGLIGGAMGIALVLAHLISHDVFSATRSLQAEADRMAQGDLRQGRVFDSEDEMGDLSRAFETMSQSLRATIARVAVAADRVEVTASEMAEISENVARVTASQVTGIREAARSMEAIDGQVKGIADSSQALNVSVEESSSTILELGAAGEELNDTASVLSSKVGEVSSSIEQMIASVKQISENTEALLHAAVETSTSMEEMASSMREVDTSAEETARLSHDVVQSAESGQEKVRQTIEGMNAIREATETAEKVIRNLGRRTKEIGAIIDVIDDVADETNLLALNAAIIAAQAGEHGRAFSVVADEIKDLADRVLASTKEIGTLIASVQEESGNAIGAIEQGTNSVASGVDLSAEAGVSLETINRAARDSGTRIAGIVSAVREQAKAAAHVAELMERVRGGVDEINGASREQEKGNEIVYRSAIAMREVAQQVRGTTEEQARGSGRIRESVDGVRDAVEQINGSIQEQSVACRSVVEFLEEISARTQSNEVSARRMDEATKGLLKEAEGLREDVHRFQI